MIQENYILWEKEEYTYPVYGEFIPNVTAYIHDEDKALRPAMLVVPGGGYRVVSYAEGEIVAKEFYEKGYNTFVVTYTTNFLMDVPLKMQALKDLSKAVVFVRKKADQFHIYADRLTICGFSAGGHLCGSLAVHHNAKELMPEGEYAGVSNRPDAAILSYPVITAGEYAHRESFQALLGSEAALEELEYMSLEKQVTKYTPPIFLWHTVTDELVPVENSHLFAKACQEQGISFEYHIFGEGNHGMSLANEAWASGDYEGYYTMQQLFETMQYLVDHEEELPAPYNAAGKIPPHMPVKEMMIQGMKRQLQQLTQDKGIALWTDLAHSWLKRALK